MPILFKVNPFQPRLDDLGVRHTVITQSVSRLYTSTIAVEYALLVFCSSLYGGHASMIKMTLSKIKSRLAMTSMILIIILVAKFFVFISK